MSATRRYFLESLVATLLIAEGLQFIWIAYAVRRLFLGAQNVNVSDPLPSAVWESVATGLLCMIAASLYIVSAGFRQRFTILAIIAILYGFWATLTGYPFMVAWRTALEGDLVALGVWSGIGFIVLGAFHLLSKRSRSQV